MRNTLYGVLTLIVLKEDKKWMVQNINVYVGKIAKL